MIVAICFYAIPTETIEVQNLENSNNLIYNYLLKGDNDKLALWKVLFNHSADILGVA